MPCDPSLILGLLRGIADNKYGIPFKLVEPWDHSSALVSGIVVWLGGSSTPPCFLILIFPLPCFCHLHRNTLIFFRDASYCTQLRICEIHCRLLFAAAGILLHFLEESGVAHPVQLLWKIIIVCGFKPFSLEVQV